MLNQGQRIKRINLPQLSNGQHWLDFETRQAYRAGEWHVIQAPMTRLPIFVVQGAQIPVAQPAAGAVPRHDDPVLETLQF